MISFTDQRNQETRVNREIPYNFTSADDQQVVHLILGDQAWQCVEELRSQRITGRSARLLMRFIGDLFIHHRNPFLFQELLDSRSRRHQFFKMAEEDLNHIRQSTERYEGVDKRDKKVFELLGLCTKQLDTFRNTLRTIPEKRNNCVKQFGPIIGADNVYFDPFTLISHATDATDWRLYLPLAVLRPGKESDVPKLMAMAEELGLGVIPRGGGTGLTGGAVPVTKDCVIINSEKLTRIYPIVQRSFPHLDESVPVLRVESGVVTSHAMDAASKEGYVFATDPTSSWACTIGGNVAENAGGKTAVLWGTAIDNALSWNISMPGTGLLTIRRKEHPMRKILPDDTVVFEVFDEDNNLRNTVILHGSEIRKKGLGKDITNKALGGLPGFQKEGTDGVITSAEFVLYREYEKKITFCLEFYGVDMDEASRVIVEISKEFKDKGEEALIALEHFDEEYIKAINYKFKAARSKHPKAVLLIDLVGHTTEQVLRGRRRLEQLLVPYSNTEMFTAQDADEGERFWRDRKRLGAISARTNAFKLNEDIVLPLHALAEFTRFVDSTNIEEDLYNKQQGITQILEYLKTAEPLEDPDWLEAKIPAAEQICQSTIDKLAERNLESVRHELDIKKMIQDLLELFRGYKKVSANIESIFLESRAKRIVIATHMHAGDGNNHVNIPVFSNDMEMMERAGKVADAVMVKAVELGGVVSGEHGIGITKMKFLDAEKVELLQQYRQSVDPKGMMNPGMLCNPAILDEVFTPSFNLLELEAKILKHSSLAELSNKIAKCIRCGKCMPDCCVYHPGSNLFFHPRNKNMVIGSLIEALLYDIQRSHQPKFRQLTNLVEVADHCTMCGKCLKPCPVDIDTARVSVLEREILANHGYKHTAPATKLSLTYLKSRNQTWNAIFRKTVMQWGSGAQQLAVKAFAQTPKIIKEKPWPLIEMFRAPMTPPSSHPLSSVLPPWEEKEALVLPPEGEMRKTVFYFPGCGSERLFADVAMASVYLLLKNGIRVVLPPQNLCCGFPLKVNAKTKDAEEVALRNSIVLAQIKDMLGYINFSAIIVSCGTCSETLSEIGCEEIFDCPLCDISSFLLEDEGWEYGTKIEQTILYHTPCHDSLKGEGAAFLRRLYNRVLPVDNCCSEAGTLALSRPDISNAMRLRKREQLEKNLADIAEERNPSQTFPTIATNCPSCLTGLGRNRDLGVKATHLSVLLADSLVEGGVWREELNHLAKKGEPVVF